MLLQSLRTFKFGNAALYYMKIFRFSTGSRHWPDTFDIPELNDPPFKKFYEAYYVENDGMVYDKKPMKVRCQKGKTYYWCSCGHSHDQPFCNGYCILPEMKIKLRPVTYKPQETREYWFCNCKQTKNRPFCDGSHRKEAVQTAKSILK